MLFIYLILSLVGRGKENETEARESGIVDEIRLDNSMANPQVTENFDVIVVKV